MKSACVGVLWIIKYYANKNTKNEKQKQSVPRHTPIVSPSLLSFKLNSRSSILNVVFGFHLFFLFYIIV